MSDPVTNVEIEDVLTSIRRLVSEEGRPARGIQRTVPDRLVLSPALRVPETPEKDIEKAPDKSRASHAPMVLTEPTVAPVVADAQPEEDAENGAALVLGAEDSIEGQSPDVSHWQDTRVAEPLDPSEIHSDQASEEPVETHNAALSVVSLDVTDDSPEVAAVETAADDTAVEVTEAEQIASLRASLTEILISDDVEEPDLSALDPADALDEPVEADAQEIDADLTLDDEDSSDTELDRKIATLEQMLHRQSHDWGTEPAEPIDAPDVTDLAEPAQVDLVEDEGPFIDAAELTDPVDEHEPDEVADETIEEIVSAAALATVVDHLTVSKDIDAPVDGLEAEQEDVISPAIQPESLPDAADATDNASAVPGEVRPAFVRHAPSQALDWEDHASAVDEPVAEPMPEAAPEQASAVAELSEEALQAIVSDIVRQELQGALGERITRNVRKLVRREIHRVMMSQDLD